MNELHNLFLLDPNIRFLNHGSFGACPKPVFAAYQEWQRLLETQPVAFFEKKFAPAMEEARHALSLYLTNEQTTALAKDIVFIPNTTFGVNIVAHSLNLNEDDELLTIDHEYGACMRAWQFRAQEKKFTIVTQPIPLPLPSDSDLIDLLWEKVTPKTKVIFISHISSITAVTFPIIQICARARKEGILTVIDGAHAPGQIPLDLSAIQADFYIGNLHKWSMSPKGSAFLYTDPKQQEKLKPLVVSWGWGDESLFTFGSQYLNYFQWQGTADPAAYLATPTAFTFQTEYQWEKIRQQCYQLALQTARQIEQITNFPTLYPNEQSFQQQMATIELPPTDLLTLKQHLYQQYQIEIPCMSWNDRYFTRVSVQGYTKTEELDMLVEAISSYQF